MQIIQLMKIRNLSALEVLDHELLWESIMYPRFEICVEFSLNRVARTGYFFCVVSFC